MSEIATISAGIAKIATQQNSINQSLASISGSLLAISKSLSDPLTKYITLISVLVALFAAWQSKKAAEAAAQSQRNEVQPVLKHHMLQYDPKAKQIIVNVRCQGKGNMYNLRVIKPTEQKIKDVLGLNAETGDFRIPPITKDKLVFRYEDVYGNEYESYAVIENNTFDGNFRQRKK